MLQSFAKQESIKKKIIFYHLSPKLYLVPIAIAFHLSPYGLCEPERVDAIWVNRLGLLGSVTAIYNSLWKPSWVQVGNPGKHGFDRVESKKKKKTNTIQWVQFMKKACILTESGKSPCSGQRSPRRSFPVQARSKAFWSSPGSELALHSKPAGAHRFIRMHVFMWRCTDLCSPCRRFIVQIVVSRQLPGQIRH